LAYHQKRIETHHLGVFFEGSPITQGIEKKMDKPVKKQLLTMLCDELEMEFDCWVPRSGISKKGNLYITILFKDLSKFLRAVRLNQAPLRTHFLSGVQRTTDDERKQAQELPPNPSPNLKELFD
jgi:DNA-binding transcriptional regulator WhiA